MAGLKFDQAKRMVTILVTSTFTFVKRNYNLFLAIFNLKHRTCDHVAGLNHLVFVQLKFDQARLSILVNFHIQCRYIFAYNVSRCT